MTALTDLKQALQDKKAVIGKNRTLKNLKLGKLKKVITAVNCPKNLKEDIKHYCKEMGCEAEHLNVPNEELGTICKKQFPVTLIGILK